MRLPRASGVLLHPTSLPGRHGIGDLGPEAHAFVDFLAATGQRWWQILPLGPTGYGNSPYQSTSSFAGNPLLIDVDNLVERGWLAPESCLRRPATARRSCRLRRRRRLERGHRCGWPSRDSRRRETTRISRNSSPPIAPGWTITSSTRPSRTSTPACRGTNGSRSWSSATRRRWPRGASGWPRESATTSSCSMRLRSSGRSCGRPARSKG